MPWQIARLLASAAELEGHPLVMSETSDHVQHCRPPGDSRPVRVVSEAEIRGTCNRLLVGGVNNITSYYSYAGLSDDQLRQLNEWVGRCCLMLRGGSQVADIGVVYPVEGLWTKFRPSRNWTSEAAAAATIESAYRVSLDSLFEARRDFTILDSRALQEARVEAGELVHGSLRWRVVVLPCVDTLPLAAWETLARFVEGGGVVTALGALPANSEREFPCSRVRELAGKMFGEDVADSAPTGTPRIHANDTGGGGIHLPAGSEALLPEGGGDFLADSGRSLAAAGWQRSYLPLSQFKLAGWSQDGDGQLDLTRVGGIKVGWGGYFGTQGETVRFSAAPPSVAGIE